MLLVTMSAMLVLFCGMRRQGGRGRKGVPRDARCRDREQFNHNEQDFDPRPVGITFEATIVSQGGDAEWCSFDLNKQVSSAGGNVGTRPTSI